MSGSEERRFHPVVRQQGDQIGQIFAHWAVVYFGQCFENYRSSGKFWTTLFHGASYASILTKNRWATIWATFSQTRLVTLSGSHNSDDDETQGTEQ
jgi:hypothetical protein